jgi:hypothetical protein
MYNDNLASIIRKFIYSTALLLLAAGIPFICFEVPSWINASETSAIWFQRSGSLVVLFSALAEFIVLKTYDYISPSEAAYSVPFDTPRYFQTIYNGISTIGIILLVSGTLIWGYGDIIHGKI